MLAYFPSGQSVHFGCAKSADLPGGHSLQVSLLSCPSSLLYLPDWHAGQPLSKVSPPMQDPYRPTGHILQAETGLSYVGFG